MLVFKADNRLMKVRSIAVEHSAIISTIIKLPFVFKALCLSIFEWSLKTGFTDVPSKARDLKDCSCLYQRLYYVFASSEVSSESVRVISTKI